MCRCKIVCGYGCDLSISVISSNIEHLFMFYSLFAIIFFREMSFKLLVHFNCYVVSAWGALYGLGINSSWSLQFPPFYMLHSPFIFIHYDFLVSLLLPPYHYTNNRVSTCSPDLALQLSVFLSQFPHQVGLQVCTTPSSLLIFFF